MCNNVANTEKSNSHLYMGDSDIMLNPTLYMCSKECPKSN